MDEFFIWGTFLGAFFLFVPIFVYADYYANAGANRLWFSLSLYGVRIFGGYSELRREGIAVHLTKKFALLLPYGKIFDPHRKHVFAKAVRLWEFRQIVEIGGIDRIQAVLVAAAIGIPSGSIWGYLRTRYPYVSFKNSVVFAKERCLKLTCRTAIVTNLLSVSIALTKKLMEALINWIRTKKSTASWKRQLKG